MSEVDANIDLIKKIETVLSIYISNDSVSQISNSIVKILNDYDISYRSTSVIPYDTFNDQILKYYKGCMTVDGKSQKTVKVALSIIKRLFDNTDNKNCKEITAYDIRFFLASVKSTGVTNVTLETYRSLISTFFRWMVKEDIIQKSPVDKIPRIKTAQEIKYPFDDIEIDKMRNNCKTLKTRAIMETLLSSGVRVSELCNLMISDINKGDLSLHVRNGKGGKDRITYVTPLCMSYITKYLDERKSPTPYLFCNRSFGQISPRSIQKLLRNLSKLSGVKNIHPHRFRRTFATTLAQNGMDIQYIRKLLGHSNINTTLRYVYSSEQNVQVSYKTHMH